MDNNSKTDILKYKNVIETAMIPSTPDPHPMSPALCLFAGAQRPLERRTKNPEPRTLFQTFPPIQYLTLLSKPSNLDYIK